MKIAICDDERADVELLKRYCKQFDTEMPISSFYSGEDLIDAYSADHFDIIYLDIEMGKLNGLEVGKQLIQIQPRPVIVFTTQSLNYAVRGYGIALRYLPKPISYETFSHVMHLALERILPYKLSVCINGVQKVISLSDILYFEVLRHHLVIHLRGGNILSARGSLSEIITQITNGSFSQPHKSYYVNMEYVDMFTRQDVVMTNGDVIPIGRSHKDLFQLQLGNYMKGNHMNEYWD